MFNVKELVLLQRGAQQMLQASGTCDYTLFPSRLFPGYLIPISAVSSGRIEFILLRLHTFLTEITLKTLIFRALILYLILCKVVIFNFPFALT